MAQTVEELDDMLVRLNKLPEEAKEPLTRDPEGLKKAQEGSGQDK